ncbi:MAG: LEA type 2 family protein [Halobacteriales archaeon]
MVSLTGVLGLVGRGLVVVVALLVVASGVGYGMVAGGMVEVGPPVVHDFSTEWGTVTDERTEFEATVAVENPNPIGVPDIFDMEYAVDMNGITVAEGEQRGVGIDAGDNDLDFEADIDNGDIPEWWVTHINNGERTDVSVSATVKAPYYSQQLDVRSDTIQTNLLGAFEGGGQEAVVIQGQQVAVIEETEVRWGEADSEVTPVEVTVTVRNTADTDIVVRDPRYTVLFNGNVMGSGEQSATLPIRQGETETVTLTMNLQTDRIEDWWPTHVQGSGDTRELTTVTTDVRVDVGTEYGYETVRIDSLSQQTTFNTSFVAGA